MPPAFSHLHGKVKKKPLRAPFAGRTVGQIEADVSEAVTKFEKEHMGRGPEETKTYIIEDMVIVRMKDLLTPGEKHLAATGPRGRRLVKQIRMEILEEARPKLEAIVSELVGSEIVTLHTDISTGTGERVIIFTMSESAEDRD